MKKYSIYKMLIPNAKVSFLTFTKTTKKEEYEKEGLELYCEASTVAECREILKKYGYQKY